VSYFAAAAVRNATGWAAAEVDLSGVNDVEEVADRLRDVDPEADLSLLFVESDDVYLVILRLDEGEDLRVFGSDSAFAEESRLGAVLLDDLKPPPLGVEEALGEEAQAGDDEESVERSVAHADVEPVGDPDLLSDLGVPAHRLLALCAQEGMLPADVTAEVCQVIGCGDEIEELREV
jgi:putative tRNA adenosine deaminase-associated protein